MIFLLCVSSFLVVFLWCSYVFVWFSSVPLYGFVMVLPWFPLVFFCSLTASASYVSLVVSYGVPMFFLMAFPCFCDGIFSPAQTKKTPAA